MSTQNTYRIAAIQMVSGDDLAENLATAEKGIAEAAERGAKLAALPEYFSLMTADEQARLTLREHEGDGLVQRFLQQCARRYGIWLIGGTVPLFGDDGKKVRSATLVYDAEGNRVARYDKRHLFRFSRGGEQYDENAYTEPGERVVCFDSPFGRIGLGICFDLRFPEHFRAMGAVDLIVLPAAFTYTTGKAHWEILLRARAIENQCYVLAPGQGGEHAGGRKTWGHSVVVDPWGTVLACRESGAGVITAELDRARIAGIRESLPDVLGRAGCSQT